ncbi:hypothetical protein AKJ09_01573 [Labilithrix luteola]|uniref:Uncharacterized protein n=1 Tax=Labilithrix luteola TaxID=1391654 RepID=A0A0K1PP64_9BACT|nr:hypothetical protein AKJ09_01573 [Labilithrix luteola]
MPAWHRGGGLSLALAVQAERSTPRIRPRSSHFRRAACFGAVLQLRQGRRRTKVTPLTTRTIAFTTLSRTLGRRIRAAKLRCVRTRRMLVSLWASSDPAGSLDARFSTHLPTNERDT